jgi:hypothetical protein
MIILFSFGDLDGNKNLGLTFVLKCIRHVTIGPRDARFKFDLDLN